jgi:hypothetical protein
MDQSVIMKASMDTPRVDTHGHLYGPVRDLTRDGLGPVLLEGCEALHGISIEHPPMMTEDQALRFIDKVSYENADRIFGLRDR